jgi:DNA-binding CsgD family transcriptional regulator
VAEYDQEVKRLVEAGWDRWAIAHKLGISYPRVGYALARVGYEFPARQRQMDENLARRLAKEGLTASEIAEQVGVCTSGVREWARRRGIPLTHSERRRSDHPFAISEAEMRRMVAEGLTVTEIMDRTGLSDSCVYKTLRVYGIQPNSNALKSKMDLSALVAEGLTVNQIAALSGKPYTTVWSALRVAGLKASRDPKMCAPFDLELLRVLVEEHRLSFREAAEILEVREKVVCYWASKHNIKKQVRDDVMRLVSFGLSDERIGKVVGIHPGTVWKIRRKKENGTKTEQPPEAEAS